jgi:glycosyltransferase involved in cell wall biosynthesis
MRPFFSVVIATWNRAPLLPRALESLRLQTFPDWEAIVVDDGSTDGTSEVMRSWLRDSRFRCLRQEHSGISAARNRGIAAAAGRWVTFLDSDDAYEAEHLASRRRFIDEHPDARFVHGGFRLVGPPETAFVPDATDPARLIPLSECAVGGTFVIAADYLAELGGFPDVPYAADFELMNRALEKGPVHTCHDPTYVYIREPGVGECEARRSG